MRDQIGAEDSGVRSEDSASLPPSIPIEAGKALSFYVAYSCGRARYGVLNLPHGRVDTPIFMPVATHGSIKGLSSSQVEELNVPILLGNAYHLGSRPGDEIIDKLGGLHGFMRWNRNILTDSGGFQMVSLLKFATITESGVEFRHPYTNANLLFTPEKSIQVQNAIGADIIMQLDDVVTAKSTDYQRFDEAVDRTTRWLDRCISAHKKPEKQNLFAIVQGGTFKDLRERSLRSLKERNTPGYAIGGLSGGESKDDFWQIIELCTRSGVGLPEDKPRYVMGVGYPIDILVCVALGADMFDCVYPCRTARFGTAMVHNGLLKLKLSKYKDDTRPIDQRCRCYCCKHYSRAALYRIVLKDPLACQLMTIHNITFMMDFCNDMRSSIRNQTFGEYCKAFVRNYYSSTELDHLTESEKKDGTPQWVIDAFRHIDIHI
ncbi:queunine tRNA-ribosyltransferase [Cryptosporidium canis]|uniref:Queuine tRNA-ribosyltransferase catalytic subunit 1 n=1 Tax=Cryptosporidium canis TaxID=195482 RepID=A0ABQ8PC03_9CRYT|nr:queunine tRNA-ribosyltransferase [Cryptosporidium canis]KAJ1615413.1 queunine tRNA-ribosyltransferase [Cryptosporidium canis]